MITAKELYQRKLRSLASLAAILAWTTSAHATQTCNVTLSLSTTASLSLLDISIDYSDAEGTFAGSVGDVACSAVTGDVTIIARDSCTQADQYCYFGEGRRLAIVLQSILGLVNTATVAECSFVAPEGRSPTAEQFSVQTKTAVLLESNLEPADSPVAVIDDIVCPGGN